MYSISQLKCLILAKVSGEYLVDLILDKSINPVLLSGFVGALSLFGKSNLGKIEEINVKGLNIEMVVVSDYGLVCILMIESNLKCLDFRSELETLLDIFYSTYKEKIEDCTKCVEISEFQEFKQVLQDQIQDFFDKHNRREDQQSNKVADFGFLTSAINRLNGAQK